MKKNLVLISTLLLFLSGCGSKSSNTTESNQPQTNINAIHADIKTTKGTVTVQLEYEKTPLTVCNFVGLAEGKIKTKVTSPGTPFYNGLTFHRVVKGHMTQGGAPKGINGGDAGYRFDDEIDSTLKHDRKGTVSMANMGPGTNGSQFFITHKPIPSYDGKYTVFGYITEGLDVLDEITQSDTITSITIRRSGEKAKAFRADQAMFDSLNTLAVNRKKAARAEEKEIMTQKISELYPEAKEDDDGYYYFVTKAGKGGSPKSGTKATVHYVGSILDSKEFANSYTDGKPREVILTTGQYVLAGWERAITEMKKGEKRTIILPPELAYGDRAYSTMIPARSWLVFELELVDF